MEWGDPTGLACWSGFSSSLLCPERNLGLLGFNQVSSSHRVGPYGTWGQVPILLAESQRGPRMVETAQCCGGEGLVPPSLSRSGHKEQLCIPAVSFSERTQAEPLFFLNEGG